MEQATVTLSLADWMKLINIIAEHPFKVVAPLINSMQQQIQSQMSPVPQAQATNGELRQEVN